MSFRIAEGRERLRDCQNVMSYQGRLDTRFGTSRLNSTTLGGPVLSLSLYEKEDGTFFQIVKA